MARGSGSQDFQDEPVALVVNAGGRSIRMGRTKALLPMPTTGMPLIVHIIRRLLPYVTDRVVVVTNDPAVEAAVAEEGHPLVLQDEWAEGGALGGIATGLAACAGWAMVVACDMPFVDAAIYAKLAEVARQNLEVDAVIPRVGGRAQPFHGLWHRRARPKMVAQLEVGELSIQAALATLNVVWMDERSLEIPQNSLAFYNVNRLAEWTALQAFWGTTDGKDRADRKRIAYLPLPIWGGSRTLVLQRAEDVDHTTVDAHFVGGTDNRCIGRVGGL